MTRKHYQEEAFQALSRAGESIRQARRTADCDPTLARVHTETAIGKLRVATIALQATKISQQKRL